MKRKVAILQSNYIPWKGYFDLIAKCDVFVLYDEVQYTKNDWRNRNLINTQNGLQWLTIPIRQENLHQKIFESKISVNNWQRKHISSLQGSYSKALFFNDFKEEIFGMYENQSDLISEVNASFIKTICKIVGIKTQIIDSRDLNLTGDRNIRLLEACKKLNAGIYISGPAAKNYLQVDLFKQENIDVEWMDYNGYKEYKQVYEPFEHGVTILDLIFNMGADARKYMKFIDKKNLTY
ncbi:MAG TPA: WbqC family protein [Bacteroidia bacterium]|nr:WbqC family protein [Bacteroidia bacterium]